MNSRDILSMGIRNLIKRKLRTFLTVLGVVVGTSAIVIMVSLGIGVNKYYDEQMKNWGDATIINIYNWNSGGKNAAVLDDKTIAQIGELPHVKVVTPVVEMYLKFVSGRFTAGMSVRGIYPEAMEALGYKLKEGEFLNSDMTGYSIVFSDQGLFSFQSARSRNTGGYSVYGGGGIYSVGGAVEEEPVPNVGLTDRYTMSYDYMHGEKQIDTDPENAPKKGDVYKIQCVGILERDDVDWEKSYFSIMPLNQLEKIQTDYNKWARSSGARGITEAKSYEQAIVKLTDMKYAQSTVEKIKELGFEQTYSPTDQINNLQDVSKNLQLLLAIIGGVSLFVAAIGIANTMVMSIYERTREIGVMKVIGAKLKDIRRLFLLEASLIGLLGGAFGIGFSMFISYLLNKFGATFMSSIFSGMTYGGTVIQSVIPIWLIAVALSFSTLIGLVSGFLPARRAMKISAISAIRTE